ncbi:MAG: lipoprotein [Faecalibacillus sp.]
MKKILKFMLAVLMVVSLAACSGSATNEQKEVVENFFTYVAKCQFDELKNIATDDVIDSLGLETMEAQLSRYNDPDTYGEVFVKETESFKKAVFEDLFQDVKIGDVEEKDGKATVKITGKYLDYSSINFDTSLMNTLAEDYIKENRDELLKVYQEEGLTAYQIKIYDDVAPLYYNEMKKALKEAKTTDLTGTFTLEEKDDQWIITAIDN